MYFGTWIDAEGQYFDTAHFPDSLRKFPFKEGGIYLLLGTVEVDYHFPTVTITKMAKMPLIADSRYSMDKEKSLEIERGLRDDVSVTSRKPYPQENEIRLPRKRPIMYSIIVALTNFSMYKICFVSKTRKPSKKLGKN